MLIKVENADLGRDFAYARTWNEAMAAIKAEQKARALEMAMAGESPLPYLKECGAANPSATWNYIRNCAIRDEPEKYTPPPPTTSGSPNV